ncbi:polysaccharide export protein [Deltaproteobacteria bacterium IMCC39524]|nr:polysaccharide export protein [Deltaproteobacteria bacterium IMCC39524]
MTRFVLIALLLLTSCWSSVFAATDDYHLGEGDVLRVGVYDHQDLSLTARIGGDGTILFPLIGQVEIAGLTAAEAGQKISRLLADGYIINPQVSIFIEQFRNRKVVMMGAVTNPGLYELSGPTTLLELISKTGGLNSESGEIATIHRQQQAEGSDELIQVDLKQLLEEGARDLDVLLRDGDNIFIAKADLVYVTGHVNNTDAYAVDDESTVLMMITRAGGFSKLAAKSRIRVVRKVGDEEKIFEKVPMNMPVLPGDVIVVPESIF